MSFNPNDTFGEIIQRGCLTTLALVGKQYPGSVVKPNGVAAAKLRIPVDEAYSHFVYMGMTNSGDINILEQNPLGPRTKTLLGPLSPQQFLALSPMQLAKRILAVVSI